MFFVFYFTEEIKSVKTLSTDFVQTSDKSAANTAFVYILVPFNDPGNERRFAVSVHSLTAFYNNIASLIYQQRQNRF